MHGGDVGEDGGALVAGDRVARGNAAHHGKAVAVDLAGEVLAQHLPGIAPVGALEDVVAGEVDGGRVEGRELDRGAPVEAVGVLAGGGAGPDRLALAGAPVVALDVAVLRLHEGDVVVVRVDGREEAVAPGHPDPVRVADPHAVPGPARTAPGRVVLQSPVDPEEGLLHVEAHRVELADGQVRGEVPRLAAVVGDVEAAVVAQQDVRRVLGVDPHGVMVDVGGARDALPVGAAVGGALQGHAQVVDDLAVLRVDADLAEVPRDRRDVAHLAPASAAVVGAVDALLRPLDHGVDGPRVAEADVEADAAHVGGGKALVQLRPGGPAVDGLVDAAAGPAAHVAVGAALALQGGRVEHVGVGRVHGQIGHARVFVDGEDALPGLAAVGGLEDPAVAPRAPKRADRGHVHDVGILRVDDDAPHVLRGAQPHVLEGGAAVHRLVDAVPVGRAAHVVGLARPHPHDVGGGGRDRDVAHGAHARVVQDRLPVDAAAGRLPDAAGRRRDVDDGAETAPAGPRRPGDRDVHDPPAHDRGADGAGGGPVDEGVVGLGWAGGGSAAAAGGAGEALLGVEGGDREAGEEEGGEGGHCDSVRHVARSGGVGRWGRWGTASRGLEVGCPQGAGQAAGRSGRAVDRVRPPTAARMASIRLVVGDRGRAARLSSVFRLCSSLIRSVTGRGPDRSRDRPHRPLAAWQVWCPRISQRIEFKPLEPRRPASRPLGTETGMRNRPPHLLPT